MGHSKNGLLPNPRVSRSIRSSASDVDLFSFGLNSFFSCEPVEEAETVLVSLAPWSNAARRDDLELTGAGAAGVWDTSGVLGVGRACRGLDLGRAFPRSDWVRVLSSTSDPI
jgi:hypothetical protein